MTILEIQVTHFSKPFNHFSGSGFGI